MSLTGSRWLVTLASVASLVFLGCVTVSPAGSTAPSSLVSLGPTLSVAPSLPSVASLPVLPTPPQRTAGPTPTAQTTAAPTAQSTDAATPTPAMTDTSTPTAAPPTATEGLPSTPATDGPSLTPSPDGSQELDPSLEGTFGSTDLTAGFTPDPFTAILTSGGSVDASYLGGGCTGFAAVAPDYEVTYTSGTSKLLRFYFDTEEDTTLLINTPSGEWVCDDDAYFPDPSIDFADPATGVYDIWVGSFAEGTSHSGTLSVTEQSSNHP